MSRLRSTFRSAIAAAAIVIARSTDARAQACCAGGNAITPGRLAMNEQALVGARLGAAAQIGSWNGDGRFVAPPAGASETDYERDLFATVRFLGRGQLSLLVSRFDTRREARGTTDSGGGLGDVNEAVRWDFTYAGTSGDWPGLALLAGVTAPTGRAPDQSTHVLASDATGIGAWQTSAGIALEQPLGAWLLGASAFAAHRFARTVRGVDEALATQWTAIASATYVTTSGVALAAFATLVVEGDATIDGAAQPGSGRRATTLSIAGAWAASDDWHLQGVVSVMPPLDGFGKNQPATAGGALTPAVAW